MGALCFNTNKIKNYIEEPEAPIEEPEAPIEEPEAPIEEPEAPIEEPEAPSPKITIDTIFCNKCDSKSDILYLVSRYPTFHKNKYEWFFIEEKIANKLQKAHIINKKSKICINDIEYDFKEMTMKALASKPLASKPLASKPLASNKKNHIICIKKSELLNIQQLYLNYLLQNQNQYAVKIEDTYQLYQPYIQNQLLYNNIYNINSYIIDLVLNIEKNMSNGKIRNIELINIKSEDKIIINSYIPLFT
jgi:hypothetical protein